MRTFSQAFQEEFRDLLKWRRDVRRFRTDPVPEDLLAEALGAFRLAPSVGLSEPWRIVRINSARSRAAALANYETANADALATYDGAEADTYASLKLSGMREAPVQLAIFCDETGIKGKGLGRATMPEMLRYSVVSALTLFWLDARAKGLGVGWVSILDPDRLASDLDVDTNWTLVAYLCVGWPEQENTTPELEKLGWEHRSAALEVLER